ncbi:MAG TPA: acyl carrier protein [Myxococcaceae bacterium]|jgi:acyl carrier protein|nr:acyl carrier protein [Myxococcaceae bacterium]
MPEPLELRVRRVVSSVLGLPIEQVTLKTSNDDVENWDSLSIVNLMMAIEEEFQVGLSPEEAGDLLSVELITQVLQEKLAQ